MGHVSLPQARRAYLGHWAAFGDWCGRHGYFPAPAASRIRRPASL